MDRYKLVLTVVLLFMLAIPAHALQPWFIGTGTPVITVACAECPSSDGDIACESFEGEGYFCSSPGWSEVTTVCASGWPKEDAAHSGTLACTDKGSQALEIKYGSSDGYCHSQLSTSGAQSNGYLQYYLNGVTVTGYSRVMQGSVNADMSLPCMFVRVNLSGSDYTIRAEYINTSDSWAGGTSSAFALNTWHRVRIQWNSATSIFKLWVDDSLVLDASDMKTTCTPRYFSFGTGSTRTENDIVQFDNIKFDDDTMPGACPQ